MDLHQYWQDLSEKKFSQPQLKKEDIMKAIHQESNSTISTLKKRLKHKLYWIIFFIILFTIGTFMVMDRPELLILISGFNFVYILGLISLGYQYKKMTEEIPYDGSTLDLMKQNARRIKKALRIETIAGLFMMPIAIVGGILFRQFSDGYTLSEILQKQDLLLLTLGLVVVLAPLLSWITSKMNDHAYGGYIRDLDANIAKMEELV